MPSSERNPLPEPLAVELAVGGPVVVAGPERLSICRGGEARLAALQLVGGRPVDSASVRQLLAGSLMAACPGGGRPAAETRQPDSTGYIFDLCVSYWTTQATPVTLRAAAERFRALGDRAATDLAERKAVEERGHDLLARRDLEAMGLLVDDLHRAIRPGVALDLVDYFHALATQERPYGVFGYLYVLERLAMMRDAAEVAAVQALAPEGHDITRCRRVHSAVGVDADHVADLVDFAAGLEPESLSLVCQAAFATASLIGRYANDAEGKGRLERYLESSAWIPFQPARPECAA